MQRSVDGDNTNTDGCDTVILTIVDYVKSSDASEGDWFGRDVTLNADGTTMLAGANGVNGLTVAAYVFNRDGGVWSEQAIITAAARPRTHLYSCLEERWPSTMQVLE